MKYSHDRLPSASARRPLLLLGFCACAFNTPAHAQDEARRHGFWAGLGTGFGWASFTCDSCSHSVLGGWSFLLNLGVTPNPHLRVGIEGDFWTNGLNKGPLPTIDTSTLLLAYYPRTHGGPYLQGGAGLSHYSLEHGTGDPLEPVSHDPAYSAAMGRGYTLGVGWENSVRLTYAHGTVGTLHGGGPGSAGWAQNLFLVELVL